MFSRIDETILFEDLSDEIKLIIANAHYDSIVSQLSESDKNQIEKSNISLWFQNNITRYDNIRTLKTRIEKAIFDLLTDELVNESS